MIRRFLLLFLTLSALLAAGTGCHGKNTPYVLPHHKL
jgi:hypothetical protein